MELLSNLAGLAKILLVIFFGLFALAIAIGVVIKALISVLRVTGYPALLGLAVLPRLAHWFFEHHLGLIPILFIGEEARAKGLEIPKSGVTRFGQDLAATVATAGVIHIGYLCYQLGLRATVEDLPLWVLLCYSLCVRVVFWLSTVAREELKPEEGSVLGIVDTIDSAEIPESLEGLIK